MAHCIALEYDRYDPSISSFTDAARQALIAEQAISITVFPLPLALAKSH